MVCLPARGTTVRVVFGFRVCLPLFPVLGKREKHLKAPKSLRFLYQTTLIGTPFFALCGQHFCLALSRQSSKSPRIFSRSVEDFRACQKAFNKQNRSLHTFVLPQKRKLKVVIVGIQHLPNFLVKL